MFSRNLPSSIPKIFLNTHLERRTQATLHTMSNSVSQRSNVCQVSSPAKRMYLRRHPLGTSFEIRVVASSAICKYSSQHLTELPFLLCFIFTYLTFAVVSHNTNVMMKLKAKTNWKKHNRAEFFDYEIVLHRLRPSSYRREMQNCARVVRGFHSFK